MAKLKSDQQMRHNAKKEVTMTTTDTMTDLERATIAAQEAVATAKANLVNIDTRIRAAVLAKETATAERRALSTRIAEGENVPDEALAAKYREIETAKELEGALREAVPGAQQAYTVAQRAERVLLADELRARRAVAMRAEVYLKDQLEIVTDRISGITKALNANEPHFLQRAIDQYPPVPELAPVPAPAPAIAAE